MKFLKVLESIYPTEIHKISETDIEIDAEADELPDGADNITLTLAVHYPEAYPDELPELSLKHEEEMVTEEDEEKLIENLLRVGAENLGMAMTFTLVSYLREAIGALIKEKIQIERKQEKRTRGTPVTLESFRAWKAKFDKELSIKKAQEEEEKLKGLTAKEREEFKRSLIRLSGRQLFERNKNLDDETLVEEGTVSVDFSQYERVQEEEKEEEGLTFSDSD
ncbi:RWD domain-containing protein [Crepidotus variabilis]|uniref:RWD domain-containing protein n=1 Tax=Crepidotus variabilis TaxID=179855 RepID=A0A9P6EPV5_9AGAR|nr:RWD domain-containing protein [Crepidotus variabilis]